MPRRAGAALLVLFCAAASPRAQKPPPGFPAKLTEPPASLPEGCSAIVVDEISHAPGTPVYRGAHREIAALRLGHEASQKLEAALGLREPAGNAMHEMVQTMTGLNQAENAYLCASYVMGQASDAEMERAQKESFLSIYNRMALETWRLENSLTMRAAKGNATRSGGADSAAAILEDRRSTDTDLLETVTQSESHLIDGGSFRMTCSERARLMSEVSALARDAGRDEFTSAAGLLEDFLKSPYSCLRRP